MNSIEFSYKKNTALGSIDKYVSYLCDSEDTVVSGYKPEIYTDINRLERDYPYTPYLTTFKNLMNKGIAVMMIPILDEDNSNNGHSILVGSSFNFNKLVSKQYNIPITLTISNWLNYYKWTLTSRGYTEEFYVTYKGLGDEFDDNPDPTNDIISPVDIGDYSEIVKAESFNSASEFLPGTYNFSVGSKDKLGKLKVSGLRKSAVSGLIGSDWYPDFIITTNEYYNSDLINELISLTKDQFSQLVLLNNEYDDRLNLGTSAENRCMILSTDNYYYENTNNSFVLPFMDMLLNYGKYQMVITDDVLADIYEPDNASEGIVNYISYNDLNSYYIDRIYDLPNQPSYFIIRYYISRFSRLLIRNSSTLKSNNTYIRDKFISDTINKMLIYDNINSIKLVNSEISDQKLSMEFEIEVNYLMNKKINFNVTFNLS